MKDTHHRLSDEFAHDILDDDIDQLYCQLEEIAPPGALVDAIMASVAHLTQSSQDSTPEQSSYDHTLSKLLMSGFGIQLS